MATAYELDAFRATLKQGAIDHLLFQRILTVVEPTQVADTFTHLLGDHDSVYHYLDHDSPWNLVFAQLRVVPPTPQQFRLFLHDHLSEHNYDFLLYFVRCTGIDINQMALASEEPLWYAPCQDEIDMFRKMGATTALFVAPMMTGSQTVLHEVMTTKAMSTLLSLVPPEMIDLHDADQYTPLWSALTHPEYRDDERVEIALLLIRAGANVHYLHPTKGVTPLQYVTRIVQAEDDEDEDSVFQPLLDVLVEVSC